MQQTSEKLYNSQFQPIENYGVVGDLNTVALVGLNGSIDFMCFPNFDSPTIFAAILDLDKGGKFQIRPEKGKFKSKQIYLPNTNVLLTSFLSEEGIGEVTDFMPVQELNRGNELVRRVTGVQGEIKYKLQCSPRFNYAASEHEVEQLNDFEVIFTCADEQMKLRLKSSVKLYVEGKDCCAEFTLKAGQKADFILLYVDKQTPAQRDMESFISKSLADDINYWKDWVSQSTYNGRWLGMVNRSALALKMMTSCRHGSLVAAPTFGLPEAIGGERNWDYRYTWIRDSSFTIYCLLNLGYTKEAESFINWVQNKCFDIGKNENLQLMYKLDGGKGAKERTLGYLSGYRNSQPVRIGNAAYKQTQLDIYGELLDAVYLYDRDGGATSYQFWLNISSQIDWVTENWKKEDEGIWEVRGGKKEFLYSKLMCWVALDRGIKIANNRSYPMPDNWRIERDKIFNYIHKEFWNEELQTFVQYKGASVVDASTLMMPLVHFISAKDSRWLSTLACIEDRLVSDFLVYRYKNEQEDDGLKSKEGTFSMCTFWYVQCLSMGGQLDKATLYFEKMLGYANHLGLYAEQLGFSGEHLGNYPQAFTHLGLISTALNLNKQLNDARNKNTG